MDITPNDINSFLQEAKTLSDSLDSLEKQHSRITSSINSHLERQKELVRRVSEKLGFRYSRTTSELLQFLDDDVWHDGTGQIFSLSVDEETKEVRFIPVKCYGSDLKEFCGQIRDDG